MTLPNSSGIAYEFTPSFEDFLNSLEPSLPRLSEEQERLFNEILLNGISNGAGVILDKIPAGRMLKPEIRKVASGAIGGATKEVLRSAITDKDLDEYYLRDILEGAGLGATKEIIKQNPFLLPFLLLQGDVKQEDNKDLGMDSVLTPRGRE